jgi:hypothetical protein
MHSQLTRTPSVVFPFKKYKEDQYLYKIKINGGRGVTDGLKPSLAHAREMAT